VPKLAGPIVARIKTFLDGRTRAYKLAFGGVAGDTVLRDLAKFCRAHETTFHADPRVAAVLEGRREVFLRIQHHLKLTDEQVYSLYGRIDT
jgi:hypothetical protein